MDGLVWARVYYVSLLRVYFFWVVIVCVFVDGCLNLLDIKGIYIWKFVIKIRKEKNELIITGVLEEEMCYTRFCVTWLTTYSPIPFETRCEFVQFLAWNEWKRGPTEVVVRGNWFLNEFAPVAAISDRPKAASILMLPFPTSPCYLERLFAPNLRASWFRESWEPLL